jgi:hypothetical protein
MTWPQVKSPTNFYVVSSNPKQNVLIHVFRQQCTLVGFLKYLLYSCVFSSKLLFYYNPVNSVVNDVWLEKLTLCSATVTDLLLKGTVARDFLVSVYFTDLLYMGSRF